MCNKDISVENGENEIRPKWFNHFEHKPKFKTEHANLPPSIVCVNTKED